MMAFRILFPDHFGGDLHAKVKIGAAAFCLPHIPVPIEPEIFFKGGDGGVVHQTAQTIALFIQIHMVAHLGQRLGRHHARRDRRR